MGRKVKRVMRRLEEALHKGGKVNFEGGYKAKSIFKKVIK